MLSRAQPPEEMLTPGPTSTEGAVHAERTQDGVRMPVGCASLWGQSEVTPGGFLEKAGCYHGRSQSSENPDAEIFSSFWAP